MAVQFVTVLFFMFNDHIQFPLLWKIYNKNSKIKINTRNQKETQEKLEETGLLAGLMGI
jgi:hypothetical protein